MASLVDLAKRIGVTLFNATPVGNALNTFNRVWNTPVQSNIPVSPTPTRQIQPPKYTVGDVVMNRLSYTPIGRNIVNFQTRAEAGTLPKINLQQYTQNIKAPVPRFVAGIGAGIGENLLNIPQRLIEGGARAGVDVRNYRSGQTPSLARVIGTGAGIASPLLDVATLGGGTLIKQTGKQLAISAGKTGVKQAIKIGAIKGAGWGALYGGLSGLSQGDKAEIDNFIKGTLSGAAVGGLVGGVTGGIGGTIGILRKPLNVERELLYRASIQPRDPKTGKYMTNNLVKPKGMTRNGWEFQLSFNKKYGRNPYAPVYQRDLAEAIKYEASKKGIGMSIRDVSKDIKPLEPQVGGKNIKMGDIGTSEWWDKNKIPLKDIQTPLLEHRLQQRISASEDNAIRLELEKRLTQPTKTSSTTTININQGQIETGTINKPMQNVPSGVTQTKQVPQLQTNQKANITIKQNQEALDKIISQGQSVIGEKTKPKPSVSLKQTLDDTYTQWIDRYNPIIKVSRQAKKTLKQKGAELRPEYDPEYLVRRLTGAGGIADYRFKTELNPILKQLEKSGISKLDMDTYLAHKRIAGFGTAGRNIYGTNPAQSQQVVNALEAKYGDAIKQIADPLYTYQNKGFQELIDAGFISPEASKIIKSQNPDYSPLYRVMDELDDYLGLPTRKTMVGTSPIQKIKGSKRQIESPIESIIGNTFRQRAAIEKNRVAKAITTLNQIDPSLGFKKVAKSSPDTITIWNGGKKEYWQVGRDIADVARGANEEVMNVILKVLQKPASILRQGATGRNPAFMIPNIVRDNLDAGITSRYGYIPFVDYISGLKSMIGNDDIYQKWQNSGAQISLGELSGKKGVQQLFTEKTAKKGLFDWISSGLDVMGKYSEQPTRVGLFKRAYQKTGNPLLAMMDSRDATVDFARMGSKMKVANSIVPFLNVNIQGFDKLIRAIKNNPGKVILMAGIYGAAPQITSTLWNLQNYPKEYAEIPQYEKDSNFVLIKGRNAKGTVDYVTIPKGNVVPAIANPIQSFIDYVYKVDNQSFSKMALNVFSDMMPVIAQGSTPNEIALKTIGSNLPQAIKPITENLLNKSFYKYNTNKDQTKEIVPYYLQNRPEYMQKYEWTPQMYQKIGEVFNVSPLKVQNLLEGYFAGYTKIPAQIVDMAYKVSRNEPIDSNDKPILQRFLKETTPGSGNYAPIRKPTSPGLIERITGRVGATNEKVMTPEQEKWAIEDMKYKMKSNNISLEKVNGKVLYRKSNGDIGVIDPSFQPTLSGLTGQTELDKMRISKFNSDINKKAKDIEELSDQGYITAEEAEKQLSDLAELKKSTKEKTTNVKTKGSKKISTKSKKKVVLRRISPRRVIFKPIRIKEIKPVKIKTIKISSAKKPNIKIAKSKKLKLKFKALTKSGIIKPS